MRLSALGDICLTLPLLYFLKKEGYLVGWVVQQSNVALLAQHPWLDHLYLVPWGQWKERLRQLKKWQVGALWQVVREWWAIIQQLRAERYQVVIDAQGLFKSWIFAAFSQTFYHITDAKAREGASWLATHLVQLPRSRRAAALCLPTIFLHYLAPLGVHWNDYTATCVALPPASPAVSAALGSCLAPLARLSLDRIAHPLVVIAPGTTWPTKYWALAHWRRLRQLLPPAWQLIFTGSAADRPLITKIAGPTDLVLAGQTSLSELMALFRQCQLVISLDSGSTHLAWATGQPRIIAIYCSTNCIVYDQDNNKDNKQAGDHYALPQETFSSGRQRYLAMAGAKPTCWPCCKRRCLFPPHHPQYQCCTFSPSPDQVATAAWQLLPSAVTLQ